MAGFQTDGSVLDKTDVTPTDEGDHDLFAHYVKKDALEKAIFEGIPTLALCGKLWLPTKDAQRFPVCPTCKDVYEQMQPGD